MDTRGVYDQHRSASARLDVIHGFLVRSYWAKDRTRERVVQSIEHSLPFGLYDLRKQVRFARVLTDYVVLAAGNEVFTVPAQTSSVRGKEFLSTRL